MPPAVGTPTVLHHVGPPGAVESLDVDGHGGVASRVVHDDRAVFHVESEHLGD